MSFNPFSNKLECCCFYFVLQFVFEYFAVHARRDGGKDFYYDSSWVTHETMSRPEQSGIKREWDAGDIQILIEF